MQAHNDIWIWLLYASGQMVHILKRAGMAVRSRTNSIHSRLEFILFFWDSLLVRVVLCVGLFWVVLSNPRALAALLSLVGVDLAIEVPVSRGTALIFGYFADSILDWLVSKIPWLERELPSWNSSAPNSH